MNTTTLPDGVIILEALALLEVLRNKKTKDEKDEKHAKEVEKQLKLLNDTFKLAGKMAGTGTPKVQNDVGYGAGVDLERRSQFRTLGVRAGEFKNNLKDFLTPRGFLDKTGLLERGSGGLISEHLDKAEFEKQGFVGAAHLNPFKKEEEPGKYSGWMNASSNNTSNSASFLGGSEESQNENKLFMDQQTVFLKQIADNTARTADAIELLSKNFKSTNSDEESSDSGFDISDLMGRGRGRSRGRGRGTLGRAGKALKRAGGAIARGAGAVLKGGATLGRAAGSAIASGAGTVLKGGATLGRGVIGALGSAGGASLATGAALVAAPFAADYVAGKLGVGGKEIDTKQDDANWERMSLFQKAESGLGRGIEKVGGLFGGNLANEAAATRIATETKYLNENPNGPSFIDRVKDTFNRGNSGTLKAQNRDEIVKERAIKAGAMDAAGNIVNTEAYNKISNKVLQEVNASGDGASGTFKIGTNTAVDQQSMAGSNGTYKESSKFEQNITTAKSVLGSETLGALFSAKGLDTGRIVSIGSKETDANGKVSTEYSNILGERKSGGLFGKDTYTLTNESAGDYDVKVEKKDYFKVKKLLDTGKGEEARKVATEAISKAKAAMSDAMSSSEMPSGIISPEENNSATSLNVVPAQSAKSGEIISQSTNDNIALKQARNDSAKSSNNTNVSNTNVSNNTQVTKYDLPTRKDDGSLNRYTGSRLAY